MKNSCVSSYLGEERISKLMFRFSVPCILSLLSQGLRNAKQYQRKWYSACCYPCHNGSCIPLVSNRLQLCTISSCGRTVHYGDRYHAKKEGISF